MRGCHGACWLLTPRQQGCCAGRRGFRLISSKETLATFPVAFIMKIYNNLSGRFMAEMVWARPARLKLDPPPHYGNVRLRSECKANWGGSNSVVHSNEISNPRPQEWEPCAALHFLQRSIRADCSIEASSGGFQKKRPEVSSCREDGRLSENQPHLSLSEALFPVWDRRSQITERLLVDEGTLIVQVVKLISYIEQSVLIFLQIVNNFLYI